MVFKNNNNHIYLSACQKIWRIISFYCVVLDELDGMPV